jgi:hypothetical protein
MSSKVEIEVQLSGKLGFDTKTCMKEKKTI